MRQRLTYTLPDPGKFRLQLLYWASQYDHFCIYDSNPSTSSGQAPSSGSGQGWPYDLLAAVGAAKSYPLEAQALENLQAIHDKEKDWLFGFLSYDLKNQLEDLRSQNPDGLAFPVALFFQPKYILQLRGDELMIEGEGDVYQKITDNSRFPFSIFHFPLTISHRLPREEYLQQVQQIKNHIRKGDIYEMNFCQEFYAEGAVIDPLQAYLKLNEVSAPPFSAFCRFGDRYLISASPERYLKKEGRMLISQPIKGTRQRGLDETEDQRLKNELQTDEKERSENVMIVDLVRNDLSRVAKQGSVNVEELFGVYSFRQVHQLISTISCEMEEGKTFTDAIRASFPMGSMTGAPKVRAMQLIEEYESAKRGLYSGAVGYIDPSGDMDLSVVIRSILYNADTKYLSIMAGSAITDRSDPAREYDECLLKAKAMLSVFNNS